MWNCNHESGHTVTRMLTSMMVSACTIMAMAVTTLMNTFLVTRISLITTGHVWDPRLKTPQSTDLEGFEQLTKQDAVLIQASNDFRRL